MSLRCSKEAVPVNIDCSSSYDVRDIISLGQSLGILDVVFLVVGLSLRMALRFSDFILSPLFFMFSHLFAVFIVVRVSGGFPFCHICNLVYGASLLELCSLFLLSRALWFFAGMGAVENTFTKNRRKTRTRLPHSNQRKSWSLRSDRACTRLGRYVATELSPKLGRYVATELSPKLGRYVATELSPKLGRYVATKSVNRPRSEYIRSPRREA
ncbi:hypothetical protein DY000_02012431 [Brassica cretica]|uniref:Uncharacterized protein n=1 Tax=Brassica cretica TaxID=69181 RepID=A0ABQ7DBZ7_BRACR|nr:hypothetical protein DY000_02012431 [Brassica cretica]